MINAFEYFPTIIYRDEHPEWVETVKGISDKYFNECVNQEYIRQTRHLGNDLDFNFLTEYLITMSKDILKDQGYNVDKYNFYLSGLWAQEVKKNGGTNVHLHKNSQLCGWLFLETPFGGSYPIYYDTRINKQMIELDFFQEQNILNATSSIHFNNVVPGTILISNSWMSHQLSVNNSSQSTKVIHFIISHNEKICNT